MKAYSVQKASNFDLLTQMSIDCTSDNYIDYSEKYSQPSDEIDFERLQTMTNSEEFPCSPSSSIESDLELEITDHLRKTQSLLKDKSNKINKPKKDSLTIHKRKIGTISTLITNILWRERFEMDSRLMIMLRKSCERVQMKNPAIKKSDQLMNQVLIFFKEHIGGKVMNGSSKDYKISNKTKIRTVIHSSDAKLAPVKEVVWEIFDFFFRDDEYYSYLVLAMGFGRDLNKSYLQKNRENIYKIFKCPSIYIKKYE